MVSSLYNSPNVGITPGGTFLRIDGTNSPIANINWAGFNINNINRLTDSLSRNSVDVQNRHLLDFRGNIVIDWDNDHLLNQSGLITVDWEAQRLYNSSTTIFDWSINTFYSTIGNVRIEVDPGLIYGNGGIVTIDWVNGFIYDTVGNLSIDYDGRVLRDASNNAILNWQNFSGGAAPASSALVVPPNKYGGAAHLLGEPTVWLNFTTNTGVAVVVPAY